jgi:predicted ATPase/DNA-binding CsgD family transcriptional regulator
VERASTEPHAPLTPEPPPPNLPLAMSTFVGREREIGEVTRLVRDNRLLTLTGPGGSGKTRLALAAAEGLTGEFEGGVFFVSLAPITETALVAPAVARALGLPGSGDRPAEELLKGYLRERQTLLLLDNFEQVLEASPLVEELLMAAPRLRVLDTSREPLHLYGEQEYPVPPLELPDPKSSESPERLARYEAVRLFVERARELDPAFRVTEHNAPAIAEICARLDGLPLAIELAAARTRLLPPEAMVARLGDRLELPGKGARNAPERQRTLRATLGWSHDLLSFEERMLFARLSVFSGGRSLAAIGAVCDPEGELDAMGRVNSLLEKNLLIREDATTGTEPRFVMLETVHEYAREKLEESGEAQELRRAHAWYFLALAEEAEPELVGPAQARWFDRLEFEYDNIRAALSWTLERGKAELGLRLAGALRQFWLLRGYLGEGCQWLEETLANEGPDLVAARAKALEALGWLSRWQEDMERTESAAEEGLRLSAEAEVESRIVASLQGFMGYAANARGDHEQAQEWFEDGLALSQEGGNTRVHAWLLLDMNNLEERRGDYRRAKELCEEVLPLARELDDAFLLGTCLNGLGWVLLFQDHQRALTVSEESVALLRKVGYKGVLVRAIDTLAWAALLCGDLARAEALHGEGLALCKDLGNRALATAYFDGLACEAGGTTGEPGRAATLLGVAEALHETTGFQPSPAGRAMQEPYIRAARSQLDEASWDAALAEGRAMGFDEAVDYALSSRASQVPPSRERPPSSKPGRPAGLTDREVEVLKLVAEGLTNAQVAERLFLSPRTVHRHLDSVYRKLGSNSRAAAARFAAEHGLL